MMQKVCSLCALLLVLMSCNVMDSNFEEINNGTESDEKVVESTAINRLGASRPPVTKYNHWSEVVMKAYEYDWSSGWNIARTFTVDNKDFLFILKESTGDVHIHRMGDLVSTRVYDKKWSTGITQAEFYYINGATYLIRYRNSDGRVWISKMKSDGTIEETIFTDNWTSGWDTFTTYQSGGNNYMMLIKSSTGDVHIQRIKSDGKLGGRTYDVKWSTGWTDAHVIPVKTSNARIMLRKQGNGRIHVREMNSDGTLGMLLDNRDWTGGWTEAMYYHPNGDQNKLSLLLYKKGTGEVHLHEVNPRTGIVGGYLAYGTWTKGWTDMQPYKGGKRAFFIKESSGEVDINLMVH